MIFPDISEFQKTADIQGIRKQTPAIIMRVAYGAEHPDQVFSRYRAEAHAVGFTFVGLYQYLVAGQDVESQALTFCKLIGKLQPGEIPILDLEEGSGDQSARADQWFAFVDAYFGLDKLPLNQRSWLYTYLSFAKDASLMDIINSDRHDWLAAYASTPPTLPHTLWQSSDGKVGANRVQWPGVGYCDTNTYTGTADQLASFAWHPAAIHPQEEEMLNVQVPASSKVFVPFPSGSFKQAMVYADFVSASAPGQARLAVHSASKGYTVHDVMLTKTEPTAVSFPYPDTDAVSILNEKGVQVGVTLS
jgi:hypothetical protein